MIVGPIQGPHCSQHVVQHVGTCGWACQGPSARQAADRAGGKGLFNMLASCLTCGGFVRSDRHAVLPDTHNTRLCPATHMLSGRTDLAVRSDRPFCPVGHVPRRSLSGLPDNSARPDISKAAAAAVAIAHPHSLRNLFGICSCSILEPSMPWGSPVEFLMEFSVVDSQGPLCTHQAAAAQAAATFVEPWHGGMHGQGWVAVGSAGCTQPPKE